MLTIMPSRRDAMPVDAGITYHTYSMRHVGKQAEEKW